MDLLNKQLESVSITLTAAVTALGATTVPALLTNFTNISPIVTGGMLIVGGVAIIVTTLSYISDKKLEK